MKPTQWWGMPFVAVGLAATMTIPMDEIRPAAVALPCTAPPAGPVHWWTFDDHERDIVNDAAAEVGTHGATYGDGRVAGALHVDGVASYAVAPIQPDLANAAQYSIEFWFRLTRDVVPGEARVFPLLSHGTEVSIDISNGDSQLEVRGPVPRPASGSRSWAGGTWYHIALTYDGATGYQLYLDGAPLSSSPDTFSILAGASVLNLGWEPTTPQVPPLPGDIDEVTLYRTVLTPDEVAAVHAGGKCKYRLPFVGPHVITAGPFCGGSVHDGPREREAVDYDLRFEPVYAGAAGEVVFADRSTSAPGLGWFIAINHPDGNRTVYAHLRDQAALLVHAGDRVTRGQLIATSGRSSYWLRPGNLFIQKLLFRPHLHVQMVDQDTGTPVAIPRTLPVTEWATGDPENVCQGGRSVGLANGPALP